MPVDGVIQSPTKYDVNGQKVSESERDLDCSSEDAIYAQKLLFKTALQLKQENQYNNSSVGSLYQKQHDSMQSMLQTSFTTVDGNAVLNTSLNT